MKRPKIGITFDVQEPGGYSDNYPWYALRKNYVDCIRDAGGLPIILPHDLCLIDDYMGIIDGLLVTGGGFDVSPHLYGEIAVHPTIKTVPERTDFEWAMTQKVLERNMPFLGICGGQQLLNVVMGGTLIQHIPDHLETDIDHSNHCIALYPCHDVVITEGTLLHALAGATTMAVNSRHHQAVLTVGPDVVINAVAPDGIIEGIEVPTQKFCLGLQWHPEFHVTPADQHILQAFIKACQ